MLHPATKRCSDFFGAENFEENLLISLRLFRFFKTNGLSKIPPFPVGYLLKNAFFFLTHPWTVAHRKSNPDSFFRRCSLREHQNITSKTQVGGACVISVCGFPAIECVTRGDRRTETKKTSLFFSGVFTFSF